MSLDASARKLAGSPDRPLVRVVLYYLILFGSVAAIVSLVPETLWYLNAPLPTSALLGGNDASGLAAAPMGGPLSPHRVVVAAVVSLASACALMLPVTWVYVQTRRKKGFDQSLVQTLIILPLVVAGVVLLVQNSTALAFSLGGIVGAVSFRNTLRDTKDAIYIFLAIVIGVAAGVHAMLVAATVSVCFNLVTVIMWWTDFGRTGALLEGAPAQDRLARAKAMANRSSGFISMVDRELLRSMTSEQLEVLAERARDRQRKVVAKAGLDEGTEARRDRTLRIEIGGDAASVRPAAEAVLQAMVKSYELSSETREGAGTVFLYRVRLKKRATPEAFIEGFKAAAGSAVGKAELID